MPPKELVTKDFLRLILKDQKSLLKMEKVKTIKVPRYPELSVKALYPEALEDENLRKYFPDIDGKKKPLDREYFFNVLNTLYPKYMETLIQHAQNLRNAPELNEEKKDFILISDDWYQQLMSHPYISSNHKVVNSLLGKRGRTVQLLKESTKIFKGRKQRQNQVIGMSLKRFKGMEDLSNMRINNEQEEGELSIRSDNNYQENERSQTFASERTVFKI